MKAALTGWAWRTPLGKDTGEVLRRLCAGESAVQANPRFDGRSYACRVAATIAEPPQASRHERFLRRMGLYAVEVAAEAMAHAGMRGSERVGLFFGYGGLRAHWQDMMPAFEHQQADGAGAWERGLTLLHPFWMLRHLSNNAHAIAAQTLSAQGEGSTFAGANAGAQALAGAVRALAAGAVDVALVVGYDSLVEPETLVELGQRGVLSRHAAAERVAPYAAGACGFAPGEAAAALVLQRPADAASPWALVQAADGADGERTEARVASVLRLAQGLAQRGDAVDGAGLAQPAHDLAERAGLAPWVGDDAALSCLSSAMGQLGAASAVVQAIALAECLRRGVWPPVAGLRRAADGPLRPLVQAERGSHRAALGLSLGAPGLAGVIRVELP